MRENTSGYTLIEVMMTIAILTLLIGSVVGLLVYYLKSYSFSFDQQQLVYEAQNSLTRIIREIREAKTGEDGSWPIVSCEPNNLIYYTDVTNDGRTDRIRYFLENNQLKRGVTEPTLPPVTYPADQEKIQLLIEHVDPLSEPVFTYYNGNWPTDNINNPLASDRCIYDTRYIHLSVNITTTGDTKKILKLESGVMLRNLKDN